VIDLNSISYRETTEPDGRVTMTGGIRMYAMMYSEAFLLERQPRIRADMQRRIRREIWRNVYGALMAPTRELAILAERRCCSMQEARDVRELADRVMELVAYKDVDGTSPELTRLRGSREAAWDAIIRAVPYLNEVTRCSALAGAQRDHGPCPESLERELRDALERGPR
jgi:hypothetical protein